jgi:DMSO/TMAO reductase YedYZ heme-binding membrane subunit
MDAMMQFHRQAGLVAFGFILGHPIIIILADRGYLSFSDPRLNLPRSIALAAVLIVLMLVIALPLWRSRLGMS